MKIAELSSRIRSLETELLVPLDDLNSIGSSIGVTVATDESGGECTAIRNNSPNESQQQLLDFNDTLDLDSDDNASEQGSDDKSEVVLQYRSLHNMAKSINDVQLLVSSYYILVLVCK
jgi:hypothetical protein